MVGLLTLNQAIRVRLLALEPEKFCHPCRKQLHWTIDADNVRVLNEFDVP